MIVNSECVNYVLATFRPDGYTTLSNPINSLIAPLAAGHTGSYQAPIDNHIALDCIIRSITAIAYPKWTMYQPIRLSS